LDPPASGLAWHTLSVERVLRAEEAILKTTTLDVRQWLICTAVALSIIAATEIRKAMRPTGRP